MPGRRSRARRPVRGRQPSPGTEGTPLGAGPSMSGADPPMLDAGANCLDAGPNCPGADLSGPDAEGWQARRQGQAPSDRHPWPSAPAWEAPAPARLASASRPGEPGAEASGPRRRPQLAQRRTWRSPFGSALPWLCGRSCRPAARGQAPPVAKLTLGSAFPRDAGPWRGQVLGARLWRAFLERFRFDWSRLAGGGWRKLSDVLERGDPSPLSEARPQLQGQSGVRSPPFKACGRPLASGFERMRPPESKTL